MFHRQYCPIDGTKVGGWVSKHCTSGTLSHLCKGFLMETTIILALGGWVPGLCPINGTILSVKRPLQNLRSFIHASGQERPHRWHFVPRHKSTLSLSSLSLSSLSLLSLFSPYATVSVLDFLSLLDDLLNSSLTYLSVSDFLSPHCS